MVTGDQKPRFSFMIRNIIYCLKHRKTEKKQSTIPVEGPLGTIKLVLMVYAIVCDALPSLAHRKQGLVIYHRLNSC